MHSVSSSIFLSILSMKSRLLEFFDDCGCAGSSTSAALVVLLDGDEHLLLEVAVELTFEAILYHSGINNTWYKYT